MKTTQYIIALIGALSGLLGGAVAVYIFTPNVAAASNNKQIVAESFLLVDKTGKKRGLLEVGPDQSASLTLYDQKGVRLVGLGATDSGTALNMFDKAGKVIRASLHVREKDGVTGITFYDQYGAPKSGISINIVGSPAAP
jgi:hypothetical protein